MLTIYKASAGSGKTYTLTYQYLRMLLGVKPQGSERYRLCMPEYNGGATMTNRHRHILAITFTNKATEEMKSRIIDELGALAADHSDGSPDCPYTDDLIAEFGCSREELRLAASRALRGLLFDYHHFNVSTIDSFFQTVLRAFAREVDRQGDYGVELNNDNYAVISGIGMMLDDLNYGNPPRRAEILKWISRYTMELIEEGKDGSMFNRSGKLLSSLASYVARMDNEIFKQRSDEVLAYLDTPGLMRRFVTFIDDRHKSLLGPLRERAAGLLADFKSRGFALEVLKSTLSRLLTDVADGKGISAKCLSSVAVSQLLAWPDNKKATYYVKNKTDVLPPDDFTAALHDWAVECNDAFGELDALARLRKACPNLEFLGYAWHYINRFREENNLILLSDTNDLISRIIGGSETPFIYERIGVALRHFLIDEFQDTSHMQWANLRPLVGQSLACGHDNLIIGDEKQAIYRFRNSDSSLLHHEVSDHDFPNDSVIRGAQASENTNHRSAHGIVRFNNALFTRMARNCGVEGFENTVQSLSSRKADLTSYITITDCTKLPSVNDYPAEFDLTAQEILRQHRSGYRWDEIAILTRTRKQAEMMVNYLLTFYPQISVLSDEALLIRNSPAVKLVLSLLKMVDSSYSATATTAAAGQEGKPVYGSTGDINMMISRYEYFLSEGHDTEQALKLALDPDTDDSIRTLIDQIVDIRAAKPAGLVALVETVISRRLSPSQRRNEYAYLAAFQDTVMKFCSLYNPSLHAFLDWWDSNSEKLTISGGADQDAVNVMTIHKSKGLQWNCVHIPFGDFEIKTSDDVWITLDSFDFIPAEIRPPLISVSLDPKCSCEGSPLRDAYLSMAHDQLVDNLNIAYVACTRPKRELHICLSSPKDIGRIILDALAQPAEKSTDAELMTDLAEGVPDTPDNDFPGRIFVSGEPTVVSDSVATDDDLQQTDAADSPDYRVFFRDDTSALTTIDDATTEIGELRQDDPDSEEESEPTDVASLEARTLAAERGTHLHAIMADIESPADISSVVARAAVRYGLDDELTESYLSVINSAFTEAEAFVVRWFNPGATVFKEQSIYDPECDSTFRPDRIVVTDDGSVEVVDYKFTTEPRRSHQSQVRDYIKLLRDMGYTTVRGYLWYPELNIINPV